MLVNLGMFILVGSVNYFPNRFDRRMAIQCECFIIMATFNLVIYTNFVQDLEFQYDAGVSFIGIIIFQLVINFFFIAKDLFKAFKLNVIKKYNHY
jgi:hypothetical protein